MVGHGTLCSSHLPSSAFYKHLFYCLVRTCYYCCTAAGDCPYQLGTWPTSCAFSDPTFPLTRRTATRTRRAARALALFRTGGTGCWPWFYVASDLASYHFAAAPCVPSLTALRRRRVCPTLPLALRILILYLIASRARR